MIAALILCAALQPPPLPSFWCVHPGAVVRSSGGQVWRATAEGADYDVVVAQGDWRAVEIDGASVEGSRWTVALPMVGR